MSGEDRYLLLAVEARTGRGGGGGMLGNRGGELAAGARPVGCESPRTEEKREEEKEGGIKGESEGGEKREKENKR